MDRPDPLERPGLVTLAAEMAAHGKGREAPVRSVMALLGDRWTTLILLVLTTGELRHAELKRVLVKLSAEQAISQRVLTLKLRTLERDGIVTRSVTGDVPPKVSYCLTPLGEALKEQARRTIEWVQVNSGTIESARSDFDKA